MPYINSPNKEDGGNASGQAAKRPTRFESGQGLGGGRLLAVPGLVGVQHNDNGPMWPVHVWYVCNSTRCRYGSVETKHQFGASGGEDWRGAVRGMSNRRGECRKGYLQGAHQHPWDARTDETCARKNAENMTRCQPLKYT